jgi:hypothetical protein
MKTCHIRFFTLTRLASLLLIALGLFLSGCQKDEFFEPRTEDETAQLSDQDVDLRKFMLSAVYDLPVEQFSEAEVASLYEQFTADLSEADRTQVNEQLKSFAQQLATSPDSKPYGLAKSGGETVIAGDSPNFGIAVAYSGGRVFVGDPDANRVVVYVNQGGSYVEEQVLTPSNGAISEFGKSLAADAGWLAIGAGSFFEGGEIYLYKRESGGSFGGFGGSIGAWEEQTVLTTSDQIGFASDIAISWPYLAAIGRLADNPVASEITVYKFARQRWSEQDRLGDGNTFFWDMDLDGGRLAANGGSGPTGPIFAPQVFVYEAAGFFSSNWSLKQQLPFPPGQLLLRAVALDGPNLIANTAVPGNQSSAYRLEGGGWGSSGSWVSAGLLVHPGIPPAFVQTRWLDVQGNKAVVCEPLGELFTPSAGDAIHVYERSNGSWQLTNTFTPADGGLGNYVGVSPVIDGNQVYVGAPQFAGTEPGKVYIFE